MGLDLTAFDAVLKDDYRPVIISLLNKKTRLLDLFTKNTDVDQSDGRQKVYPIHTGRNEGVGSVSEGNNVPTAGNEETGQVKVPYKYTYGRIQLTAQTIKASKTSKGAFKSAMKLEMNNMVTNLAKLRNRQLWGHGVGILARVDGQQTTATTVNLKSPLGYTGTVNGCRFLRKNMWIAFITTGTLTSKTDSDIQCVKKVSSISSDGKTVTLTAATGVTLEDGDFVVLAPAGGDTTVQSSVNKEPMGLTGIVDDGTYLGTLHNIARATYDQYNSSVISLNGSFSIDALQRGYDLADEKAGGEISHLLAHHSVRREYLKQLQLIKRYTNEMAMKPDGGFKGGGISTDIEFSEKPMIAERMAPYGTIFGIDKSDCVRFVNCEGEWADDDGSVLGRVLNVDSYEGRFRIFENYHNDRPDKCFRIDGVTATVDVTPVE